MTDPLTLPVKVGKKNKNLLEIKIIWMQWKTIVPKAKV